MVSAWLWIIFVPNSVTIMVYSMTGFGQASDSFQNKSIAVEIRSLNGKNADVRMKIPPAYKEKEMEIRKLILDSLSRGKIDLSINVISEQGEENFALDMALFKRYYRELSELQLELKGSGGDILSAVMKIPNVIMATEDKLSTDEWNKAKSLIHQALEKINSFRETEGKAMETDLIRNIEGIKDALQEIIPYESERVTLLKERFKNNLDEFMGKDNVDKNRFEQEVLFYMEKLDINEEKVRLEQHCQYFLEELGKGNVEKGKKLGFISQEIGREINTIGSKAQFSPIQKRVVIMKNELEKIKEQVANIV